MAVSPPSASDLSPVPPNTPLPAKPAAKRGAPLLLGLIVIVFCLVVIGGVAYFFVYPQLSAGDHWRAAKKAIENNHLAEAQGHLESCVSVWAKDGEVQFLLARTCRRLGQFDKARLHLQLAAKQHWVPEQIKLETLLMRAQTGFRPETTTPLQDLLKAGHRDDTLIFEALIIGCLQINNFREANRWTTIWTEQHPDDWLGRFWLGVVFEEAGQLDLAAEEYKKALDLNPNGWELHLRLAEALMQGNSTEEAATHYQAALDDDPNNPSALLGLARCQHSLGTNETTRITLNRLMKLDPENFEAYSLRGQMALEEENLEHALHMFDQAHAINPSHLITNRQLAWILHKLKRDVEAQETERRIQEIEKQILRLDEITKELLNQPKDVLLRDEAGSIHFNLGNVQKAFRWFVSALLIDPKHQPTKEHLRKCLQRMGDQNLLEQYKPFIDAPS